MKTNQLLLTLGLIFSLPLLLGAGEATIEAVASLPLQPQALPVWFLVLSLFLPRISLIAAFFTDGAFPHLITKWVTVPMGFFIPRVLIVWGIAATMGICAWFWIHLIVAVLVFLKTSVTVAEKKSK